MTVAPAAAVDALLAELGPRARRDVSLADFSTYRVGGPAAALVEVDGPDDLEPVVAAVGRSGLPVLVVGRGSNLLVADAGFPGVVLHLGDGFAELRIEDGLVAAGGAALLPVVARRTVAAGWANLAWMVGVPGSVGGAVRMNAGGHGRDVAADLIDADVVDLSTGERTTRPAGTLGLAYRHSDLGPAELVVGARFRLEPDDGDAEERLREIVAWRRAHQPGGANAGSVFANPDGDSAGRLVDAAGLKGHRIGSAEVSTKHANFIQADPGGSADDVHALIRHVQRTIHQHSGILLRPENRLIGFEPTDEPTP